MAFVSEFVLVYILVYAHYEKLGDKYKEVSLYPKNLKFFTLMAIKIHNYLFVVLDLVQKLI